MHPKFKSGLIAAAQTAAVAAGCALLSAALSPVLHRTFADLWFLASLLVLAAGCLFVVASGPKSHTGTAFRRVFGRGKPEQRRAQKIADEERVLNSRENKLFSRRAVVCFAAGAVGIAISVALSLPA